MGPRLRNLGRALLVGVAMTIAVAWGHSLVPVSPALGPIPLSLDPDGSPAPRYELLTITPQLIGGPRYEWVPVAPIDPLTDFDRLREVWAERTRQADLVADSAEFGRPNIPHKAEFVIRPAQWPDWAGLPHGRAANSGRALDEGMSVDARGFPLPALCCYTVITASTTPPRPQPIRFGIPLRGPTGVINDQWAAIPLMPIPINFLVDTLFFAAAWWAVIFVRESIRQSLQNARALRNLCPSCGYARVGLAPIAPCPECGHKP